MSLRISPTQEHSFGTCSLGCTYCKQLMTLPSLEEHIGGFHHWSEGVAQHEVSGLAHHLKPCLCVFLRSPPSETPRKTHGAGRGVGRAPLLNDHDPKGRNLHVQTW